MNNKSDVRLQPNQRKCGKERAGREGRGLGDLVGRSGWGWAWMGGEDSLLKATSHFAVIVSLALLEKRGLFKLWCDIIYVKGEARQNANGFSRLTWPGHWIGQPPLKKFPLFERPIQPIQKVSLHSNFFEGRFGRPIEKVVSKIQYMRNSAPSKYWI